MGNKSTNSVPKIDLPDPESDQLATPVFGPLPESTSVLKIDHLDPESDELAMHLFDFGLLPLEIQEMILMRAAVERRLACETFGEVYAVLAPVCKLWHEMLNAGKFYEKVERQTFLKDPMRRYLRTVQSVPFSGLQDNVSCVATLGNKLYVVADDGTNTDMSRIFVYDLDDSAVRHKVRKERKIVCSNRRLLEINGLVYTLELIMACPRTNTLYVIEHDAQEEEEEEDDVTKIHKINADDGTVLGRWEFEDYVNYVSLSPSGSYLIVTCYTKIFVYDTSTFALVKTEALADESFWVTGVYFTSAILSDNSLDSLVTCSTKRDEPRVYLNLVHDDYQCRLLLTQTPEPRLDLIDKRRADQSRRLHADLSITADICLANASYDEARGLLFCPVMLGGINLRVLRITY